MPDFLDSALASLSEVPLPPLAEPDRVRRRGDQRRRRTRVVVACVSAMAVLAVAGTAVALGGSGTRDTLVPAGPSATAEPTPTTPPSAGPTMPRDPKVTWAAFPSVTRMGALAPGDWASGQVQVVDQVDDAYRCRPDVVIVQVARAEVSRRLFTSDFQQQVVFMVQDYASASDAATVFAHRLEAIRRCPTVTTDGPAAGSQQTSTVLDSSRDAYTLRNVQRECQRPNADCSDSPGMQRTALRGHLLLTVTAYRTAARTFSQSELKAFMDDFAQQVETTYGLAPATLDHPTPQSPTVGGSYFGAFLWTGNVGQSNGEAEAQRVAAPWGKVVTTRLDCLEGGASAVGRSYPGASHGDAVALLFTTAQQTEYFLDLYDGPFEGVGPVRLACLR